MFTQNRLESGYGWRRLSRHRCKWHTSLHSHYTPTRTPVAGPLYLRGWLQSDLHRCDNHGWSASVGKLGLCQGKLAPASLTAKQEAAVFLLREELLMEAGSSRDRCSAGKDRHFGDFDSNTPASRGVINLSVPRIVSDLHQRLNTSLLDEHISCQGVTGKGYNLYPAGVCKDQIKVTTSWRR